MIRRRAIFVAAAPLLVGAASLAPFDPPPLMTPYWPELRQLRSHDLRIDVEIEDATIEETLRLIARSAGLRLRVVGSRPAGRGVTLGWTRVTVADALIRLALQHDLRYEVPGPSTLVVHLPPPR